MPPARRPIQSKPDPRRPAEPPAPKCQANSLPVTPRHAQGPASVLNAPNCAKMAHLGSLLGYGGGTGGIRWGHGGETVGIRCPSGVAPVCHFGTKPPPRPRCQVAISTLNVPVLSVPAQAAIPYPVAVRVRPFPAPFALPSEPASNDKTVSRHLTSFPSCLIVGSFAAWRGEHLRTKCQRI